MMDGRLNDITTTLYQRNDAPTIHKVPRVDSWNGVRTGSGRTAATCAYENSVTSVDAFDSMMPAFLVRYSVSSQSRLLQ